MRKKAMANITTSPIKNQHRRQHQHRHQHPRAHQRPRQHRKRHLPQRQQVLFLLEPRFRSQPGYQCQPPTKLQGLAGVDPFLHQNLVSFHVPPVHQLHLQFRHRLQHLHRIRLHLQQGLTPSLFPLQCP